MKDKKISIFVFIGIFGSVGVAIAMIVAGGATFNFTIVYAGIGVLVGGIMLTVAILTAVCLFRYAHSVHEIEPVEIISQKPTDSVTADTFNKEKDVSILMNKEDAFIAELKQCGKLDLLKQYEAEAELIWEQYTGDTWDENLQQIDELIDKYKNVHRTTYVE